MNDIFYADVFYKREASPILRKIARNYAFKDLTLTSFNKSSYAVGFGEKDEIIIPSLFKSMSLFNIGFLRCDKAVNLDFLEEFITDYLVLCTKEYTNSFINVYEGFKFHLDELNSLKNNDRTANFGKLTKPRDFISVVKDKENIPYIVCHSKGTDLVDKCIEIYSTLALEYILEQKKVRLDVLNSTTSDFNLRKIVQMELEKYTVDDGLEFLPPELARKFKEDLSRCITINYMNTMSILLLLNDTFRLSTDKPNLSNQICDHFSYNTLHINFRLLMPQEQSFVFNPSTFEFLLLQNISDVDLALPAFFQGEGIEIKKDRKIWVDYDKDNQFFNSMNYVPNFMSEIDFNKCRTINKFMPLFVYAT